jgi:hypothetical protein
MDHHIMAKPKKKKQRFANMSILNMYSRAIHGWSRVGKYIQRQPIFPSLLRVPLGYWPDLCSPGDCVLFILKRF